MSEREMTQGDYYREVQSLAESILSETLEYEEPDATDDQLREALGERLWQDIDGHQWVIYTAYNFDVMRHSDNDSYYAENFGAETLVVDGTLNTAAIAFGALYADVSEVLWRLFDEREEEVA